MVFRLHAAALAVGAAVATLCAAPAFAVENLIENGSFEKPVVATGSYVLVGVGGSVGKWTVVGASGDVAPISGAFQQGGFTFPAKKGAQWLDLTGVSNSATGVEQTVRTKRNAAYELSFFVGNVSGAPFGETSSVQLFVDDEPVMVAVNAKAGQTQSWKRFSTTIVAAGSRTKIRFINGDVGSDSHNGLDAVSLEQVGTE